MAVNNRNVTGWVGWAYFAGFMMLLMGAFQIIMGLTALLNDKFYIAQQGKLLTLDITQWGWIHLLFGVVILMAGTSLFSGHKWARVVALVLATLNFIAQFSFVSVYPIWSITMMVVDVFVIYALTVHGAELEID